MVFHIRLTPSSTASSFFSKASMLAACCQDSQMSCTVECTEYKKENAAVKNENFTLRSLPTQPCSHSVSHVGIHIGVPCRDVLLS